MKNSISKNSEKTNPAFHLFLYLAMFFSLGFVVFGAVGSFFALIDKTFESAVESFYQESLRSAIASLVIAIPAYYSILFIINNKLAKGEIEPDSGIRKAISYLAIFVFFAMSIGSLVSLLFGYLNGELAEVSFLKTLVFLAISALMFAFYFWEIKRASFSKKVFDIYFSLSLLIAFSAVATGFAIVDSPRVTREKKQDREIIEAMENARQRIENFYFNNGKLMESEEFENIGLEKDVREKIIYNISGDKEYELCSRFNYSSEDGYIYDYLKNEWRFPAGDHCFKLRIRSDGEISEKMIR
ncbi:MAG: DUF5671 domain-containing protein [Candidatus Moranbacteria bacterium]|nr:DUF5671 domain-containing protein [Candidatus Moranbacteria bacterium]MDD5652037.1 DUF5671 domain-containing protein [Candidatus Moranbacteria bacterium]MDX9855291.1 DUF5671 domain-containing protein [Candidatus Moranbacteria bacterium]